MVEFLAGAGLFILAMVAIGLARMLRGPEDADRVMATQLLGTGGITMVLIVAVVANRPTMVNAAMTLALLAAFAGLAYVRAAEREDGEP
jgi:multicomponent Na+:H+ antiporter subunit F